MSITITLIGADARFSASIAQLLKLKTKSQFVLGDHGDITLIDADTIDGKKATEKPLDNKTIILTVTPEQFDHALVIRKPIKVEELIQVLENIVALPKKTIEAEPEQKKATNATTGNPFAKFMDPDYLKKRKQANNATKAAEPVKEVIEPIIEEVLVAEETILQAEKLSNKLETTFSAWKALISDRKMLSAYVYDDYFEQIEQSQLHEMSSIYTQNSDIYYDMSGYASLHLFKEMLAKRLADALYYFKFKDGLVFLFSDGVLVSNLPKEAIETFANLKQQDIQLQTVSNKTELLTLLGEFESYYFSDALAVFSRSVLLAAKGRIINGRDIKEPLGLMKKKDSVNLSISMPHAKEMDSVWGFRNVSLRDTAELLTEVNPYYIFSYYTLCDLYGYFDSELVENKSKNHLDLNALLSELQKL